MRQFLAMPVLLLIVSCSNSQVNTHPTDRTARTGDPASNVQSKPGDVIRFSRREVIDREGTGMVASTYLLPPDWKVQDRLYWEYNDASLPIRVSAKLQSEDGTMGIQIFPDVRGVWSNGPLGTSGYAPPDDIISGLKTLIQSERQGVHYSFTGEKILQDSKENTAQGVLTQQSGIVSIAYTENGRKYDEEFYANIDVYHMVTPGVYGSMQSLAWAAGGIKSCKASDGRMEKCQRILETLTSSAQLTKPFYNRLMQVTKLLSDQVYAQIYQAGQISKIISQTNDQFIANIDASWRQSNEAYDRINQNYSDYIRGVDRYDDGGTQIELPSGYGNAWVNDKGEYLLSSSPGYNPSADFYGNWRELGKK